MVSFIDKRVRKKYMNEESHPENGKDFLVHITYPYISNVGDTVLSKCVRDTILLQGNVKYSFQLVSVKKILTYEDIKRYNESKGIVVGGGGLFLPDTNPNRKSGWQWQCSVIQYKMFKKPLIVFAVGYNYFYGQTPNQLFIENVCELVRNAAFVGLRNNGSVRAVRALLPEELREKVVYQPCPTTIINRLYPIKKKGRTKKIAVNLAFDRETLRYGTEEEKRHILEEVARALKQIQGNRYKIYYLAHVDQDLKFLPYLNEFGVKHTVVDLSKAYPNKVFSFYKEMDVVLGMRGHAQMIPFGVGRGIITLGTHDKMKWFLEDINALDLYVDLRQEKNIQQKIVKIFKESYCKNYNDTMRRLRAAQDKLYQITVDNVETICEKL